MLDRLLGGDTDVVIAGDSMMRQLYVRLIQLLRGRQRIFDYRVCSAGPLNVLQEVQSVARVQMPDPDPDPDLTASLEGPAVDPLNSTAL